MVQKKAKMAPVARIIVAQKAAPAAGEEENKTPEAKCGEGKCGGSK